MKNSISILALSGMISVSYTMVLCTFGHLNSPVRFRIYLIEFTFKFSRFFVASYPDIKSPGRICVISNGGLAGELTYAELVGIVRAVGFFFRNLLRWFIFIPPIFIK